MIAQANQAKEREIRLINREEYYKMAEVGILKPDERVELINGKITRMCPTTSLHASMVQKLTALLYSINNPRIQIRNQNPIILSELIEPEPDLAICKFRDDYYASSHPKPDDIFILIEVSKSTLHTDLNEKMMLYANAGIKEYWVFDLVNNQVIQFTTPTKDKYQDKVIYSSSDVILASQTNIQIEVSKIYG